ncbi:MAG: ATP-dependent RecD-like DNA helicase [Clostridiales bacterium]|nr:ATP-dependent RecD-like DNA helicase [Clostridiales bacterium]
MAEKKLSNLEGCVDSVIYKNKDNGFAVLVLDAGGEPVTVVGEIGAVEEGEDLKLIGKYIDHPKFGLQFKAHLCERALPKSAASIQKYLASGVIKGIGPVIAKKIVQEFGDKTLEIFDKTPDKLLEIEGITPKKLDKIMENYKQIFGIRSLMIFMSKNEVPATFGVRAWKRWETAAQEVIKSNPYSLCGYGIELPFSEAERVADSLSLRRDSIDRIRAGISWVLSENAKQGHTCLPKDKLADVSTKFLDIDFKTFSNVLMQEVEEKNLYIYNKNNRQFVMLNEYYQAEDYISRRLKIMRDISFDNNIDFSNVIDIAEEQFDIAYEEIQRKAINMALSNGFLVLTGGPGTGKTTTLNGIISLFQQQGLNVMIAAPTGKAAKRISELTGFGAKTIHRLLEVEFSDGDRPRFKHNENNQLDCEVMIVDEMSMVDTLLFDALLKALPFTCHLVMVGDCDQLPSVGAGNILNDIIKSKIVPTIQLKEVFRQSQESKIVTNAHKIVSGVIPDLTDKTSDFFFFQRLEYPELQNLVVDLMKNRLPQAYGYDTVNDIQVLSPTRKGPTGTIELNKRIQYDINPKSKDKSEIKSFLYTYRVGDKVMQTRNNYDITWKRFDDEGETVESGAGVFNGDIGIITNINKILGVVTIDFDGRIYKFNQAMLEHIELAYVITVHKSQGSEFDVVILTVFGGYDKLYYRNLLYTAVTRAKKMLIIIGSTNRVEFMINNNRRSNRYTTLLNMLCEDVTETYGVE